MTLDQMLETFDELSLQAISSKGVIRRAKRELSSSKHSILDVSDDQAKVSADGQTVTLTDLGPRKASCTCPATGVCRHIVLSVLLLKERPKASSDDKKIDAAISAPVLTSAKDQALQLSNQQLKKYAGADWNQALIVAESYQGIEVEEHGLNCTLSITDGLVKLTLISGQSIKESVYKGPKTKQRLLTCVCLLLLHKQSGMALDLAAERVNSASETLSVEFLSRVKKEVLRSVVAVLTGTPEIAVNRLYDLAISARVQSAPRLVSQLRTLAKQASLATTRHISFQASSYLKSSASTYALLIALEKSPGDVVLTGELKRNFLDAEPLTLWVLGATKWKTPNGARGLTAYAYSEETGEWYSVVNARAAGSDPLFDPESAYRSQVWGAGLLCDLVGGSVLLDQPRVSEDGQISLTLKNSGQDLRTRLSCNRIVDSGACYSHIMGLREHLSRTLGNGIRRPSAPKPFLFTPKNYTTPYFDDINQVYYWGLLDSDNNVISLEFSGEESELVRYLADQQHKIKALLVTAEYGLESVRYKLCTVLAEEQGSLRFFNVCLDQMVHSKTVLDKIKSTISLFTASEHLVEVDPVTQLSDSVIDACVRSAVSHLSEEDYQVLAKKAETLGLEYLSTAITQMKTSRTPDAILKAAYIATEVQLLAYTT